jgi:hypothetical protein
MSAQNANILQSFVHSCIPSVNNQFSPIDYYFSVLLFFLCFHSSVSLFSFYLFRVTSLHKFVSFLCILIVFLIFLLSVVLFASLVGWLSLLCFCPSTFLPYYVSNFHLSFLSFLFFFMHSSVVLPSPVLLRFISST